MSSVRLTTSQALVRFLACQHSERDGEQRRLIPAMFGIFGHGNVAGIGQALEEHGGDGLPYLQARNEQSMVHAASGFAKASRRLSTLACTSSIGPGATNMVTGAALATINRLPVLLLPGDTYATRRQGPVLQQLEHPSGGDVSVNDCFRPVARYFDRITRPEQLITALPEAMRVLTSVEETGAVVLALPQDIQSEAYDFPERFLRTRIWPVRRPPPAAGEIERIAALIAQAKRPLIVAGGGVIYSAAEHELEMLAGHAGIPVAETFGGKGAVTKSIWWGLGGLGLEGNPACNEVAAEADLVLSVGTRMTDFATGSQSLFQHPEVRFASINVCDRDARKQSAAFALADARLALVALSQALLARGVTGSDQYRADVIERRERWIEIRATALDTVADEGMSQANVIGAMQDTAEPGDTIIAAAGGPPGDLLKTWDATEGRDCHLEFGYSCMGYELPAALGVRLARAEGEVIAFIGDGTFLMNPTELVTAVQEGLKITVVISENRGFQVIRRLQMLRAGREFGNEFRSRSKSDGAAGTTVAIEGRLAGDYLDLDLAKVAEGFGAEALRAGTVAELSAALATARRSSGAVVIVCETLPHADLPGGGVWWDVAPSEVSADELVNKLRAEYDADRDRLQRYYG